MKKCAYWMAVPFSALLLWAAFPPAGETAALAFALAPMLALARRAAPKRSAALFGAFGFLYWFATLSWMPAIVKNGGPWPLVVLGWLCLAAVCGGYCALFGGLAARYWRRARERPSCARTLVGLLVVEPVLWAGTEWLRATLFTGFAWNFLGTALGAVPSLAAVARWGGVYAASALVILVNGVFATLLLRVAAQMRRAADAPRARRLRQTLETALPLALVLLFTFLPRLEARRAAAATGGAQSVRVALVQRNAPCRFVRGAREDPYAAFGRLLGTAAAAKPHLMVWAESAMSEFGGLESPRAQAAFEHFSRQLGGAALLAGGDWRREGRYHNGVALYTAAPGPAAGPRLQLYAKQHLVPFGEYIPLDKWIPILQKLSPVGVSCWPGEAKLLELPVGDGAVKLAPLICYEDTDPVLARRAARLGAQAIVLVTNDSWFSHSQETVQHAAQAVLRAIETGLPVVRVGNAGVTGLVGPSGRTRWLEDGAGRALVDGAGAMVENLAVPVRPVPTPYTRLGDAPLLAAFALALALALMSVKRHDGASSEGTAAASAMR